MRRKLRCRTALDITITDRNGKVVETRHIESDLILRNWLCLVKVWVFNTALTTADAMTDVLGNVKTSVGSAAPRQMLGSGTTAATSADIRIQTPLYTATDAVSVGTVLPGSGNAIVLAITAAHTFTSQTTVTEAGVLHPGGSNTVYLTASNIQTSRDVFAAVTVPAGGTFTGTYTFTLN